LVEERNLLNLSEMKQGGESSVFNLHDGMNCDKLTCSACSLSQQYTYLYFLPATVPTASSLALVAQRSCLLLAVAPVTASRYHF
jgi:hypothetical protein